MGSNLNKFYFLIWEPCRYKFIDRRNKHQTTESAEESPNEIVSKAFVQKKSNYCSKYQKTLTNQSSCFELEFIENMLDGNKYKWE